MLGFDREARIGVVIKLHRIELAPVLGIVAALAVGDLLVQLTVGRLVTANTGHRRQRKLGRPESVFLLVTVFAIDHRVSALQCEPRGRVVVELVLPADGHPARGRLHPAVFFVTQHAGRPSAWVMRVDRSSGRCARRWACGKSRHFFSSTSRLPCGWRLMQFAGPSISGMATGQFARRRVKEAGAPSGRPRARTEAEAQTGP